MGSLHFSRDGRVLVVGAADAVSVVDGRGGERRFEGGGACAGAACGGPAGGGARVAPAGGGRSRRRAGGRGGRSTGGCGRPVGWRGPTARGWSRRGWGRRRGCGWRACSSTIWARPPSTGGAARTS